MVKQVELILLEGIYWEVMPCFRSNFLLWIRAWLTYRESGLCVSLPLLLLLFRTHSLRLVVKPDQPTRTDCAARKCGAAIRTPSSTAIPNSIKINRLCCNIPSYAIITSYGTYFKNPYQSVILRCIHLPYYFRDIFILTKNLLPRHPRSTNDTSHWSALVELRALKVKWTLMRSSFVQNNEFQNYVLLLE